MEKLYTLPEISIETGVKLSTLYQRSRVNALEPMIIDGIMYFNEEDIKILMTKMKRGRKPNAQDNKVED